MRKIIIIASMLSLAMTSFAQNKDNDAIKTVLKQYNNAVGKLDVTGTEKFFTADSKIYKSGGSEGNYAFTTETYNYTIIVLNDNTEVKRKGVATSVLKKVNGEWKIMINHNSSRK